jgi:hypothetical protein
MRPNNRIGERGVLALKLVMTTSFPLPLHFVGETGNRGAKLYG